MADGDAPVQAYISAMPGWKRDDANWMKHTLSWADYDIRTVRLNYRPVHSYTLSNEIAYIEPKERVY